jgi:CheY-like chemotaxis protein
METQKKYKVLLVDDNKNFLKVLRFQLQDMVNLNIKVIDEAYDGQEALAMVEKNSYDFIFMDIDMPFMDGTQATRKIKARYPHISVIAMSLHNSIEYINTMLDAGVDEYFTKDNLDEDGLTYVFSRKNN